MADTIFELGLFGEGGGADGAAGAEGAAGAQAGPDEAQQGEDAERRAAFDEMIAANKDLYEERFQQQLDRRMKGANRQAEALRGQVSRYERLAQSLAARYGVDPGNLDGLEQAVAGDQSWLEEQAAKNGLTVEQQKHVNALEAENRRFKAVQEQAEAQANSDRVLADWQSQAEALKQEFPEFDLDEEVRNNPEFVALIVNDRHPAKLRNAYISTHFDDIVGGAMQYAVQRTAGKVAASVRANGAMPVEGAGRGGAAAKTTLDPNNLTKEQCDELERRARRGERITVR